MRKYIKIFCMISILITVFTFSNVFAANVDVQINGEIIDFTDANGNKVNAQIINDRTMVPLRKIFEVLGCEIEWDGSTRTVTATKQDKEIILQIDNKIATKKENGVEEKITLDVAPTIVDDRTLVPLRFIAESLDKQVGWDSSAYTAIIIDYDYFANLIQQKNVNLYNILNSENVNYFSVTREYVDGREPANNNTATIKGNIIKNGDSSNVTLTFEGNNDLIKDIASEGWSNITYDVKYDEEKIYIKTQNAPITKILDLNANEYNEFDTESLNLDGSFEDDLAGIIRTIFDINESRLTIGTFNKMKTDFDRFLNAFVANGARPLNKQNAKLTTFDYSKFNTVVYGNEVSTNLSFINSKIFNYSFVQDDVFYDWPQINYNMNCENGNLVLKITLQNEYNEKVNYTIVCKSN